MKRGDGGFRPADNVQFATDGAFTVSNSNIPGVIDYIQKQCEHHTGKTIQEEFVELLRRHEIDYEEKYLWD